MSKIVQLAKYYLPHLGGVEIHLKEINSLLVKLGHEVTVITIKHDLRLSETANYNGVKVIRIPKKIFSQSDEEKVSKQLLWQFIKDNREIFHQADVVQVHDVFWWILPIYKSIRKKTFITFHGWETEYPVKLNAKIQRYLYSKLSRGSIHVGSWIQNFYFDKPIYITNGAINAKRLTKSRIRKEKKLNNAVNITFVGRLSVDNDLIKYINLIEKLNNRGQKVNITWVGDGEFRNQCQKLGKVTGFVKNVSKYLVNRDLIFSSSYLSILEAQLLENNVCSFYSNNLKKAYLETFPGSKYMLIADNVDSMVKKITLLLSSPKSKIRTGKKAAKFAKSQTWQKVLDLYFKLWRDCI